MFSVCEQHLIEAARPRFVRVVDALQTTETMKITKQPLLADGIDLTRTGPLWVYDKNHRTYVRIQDQQELSAYLPSL